MLAVVSQVAALIFHGAFSLVELLLHVEQSLVYGVEVMVAVLQPLFLSVDHEEQHGDHEEQRQTTAQHVALQAYGLLPAVVFCRQGGNVFVYLVHLVDKLLRLGLVKLVLVERAVGGGAVTAAVEVGVLLVASPCVDLRHLAQRLGEHVHLPRLLGCGETQVDVTACRVDVALEVENLIDLLINAADVAWRQVVLLCKGHERAQQGDGLVVAVVHLVDDGQVEGAVEPEVGPLPFGHVYGKLLCQPVIACGVVGIAHEVERVAEVVEQTIGYHGIGILVAQLIATFVIFHGLCIILKHAVDVAETLVKLDDLPLLLCAFAYLVTLQIERQGFGVMSAPIVNVARAQVSERTRGLVLFRRGGS